jgi:hypothetical protein
MPPFPRERLRRASIPAATVDTLAANFAALTADAQATFLRYVDRHSDAAIRTQYAGGAAPVYQPPNPYPQYVLDGELQAALADLPAPGPALAFAGVIATLRRGVRSICVGMVSDSTGDDQNAGSPVDEWPGVLIQKLAADYPAYTVQERNWDDATQGYRAAITRQTGTGGGERGVRFVKATPGSMQYPGAAVTAALDVQAKINPTAWTDSGDRAIACKWEAGTNQRSFLFLLGATGSLALNHSAAGTAAFGQKTSSVTIPATVNPGNGNPLWVRATLTLDNAAGGHDVRFYTSPDGTTWTQLGTTQTGAGVTTLFGGTAPYQLGALGGGQASPFDGIIYRARVYGVIDGKRSMVPPLLDDWDNYQTNSDRLTFVGAPILTLLNGGQSGQNVAYFDNATRRPILHQPFGQAVVMVSSAHNDGTQTRQVWLGNYGAMINNIKGLLPGVPILCLGQNQTGPGGAFALNAQDVEHRATRGAMVAQWAASQAGTYFFDAWPLVTPADTIDQLHPTTGTGSGSEKWGLALYQRIVSAS